MVKNGIKEVMRSPFLEILLIQLNKVLSNLLQTGPAWSRRLD